MSKTDVKSNIKPITGAAISFLILKSIRVRIHVKTPTATLKIIQMVVKVLPKISSVETF